MSELSEKLFRKSQNVYDADVSKEDIFAFGDDYKEFLSAAKTERLTVEKAVELLKSKGFKEFEKIR